MGLLFGSSRRRRSVFSYIPLIRWVGPIVSVVGISVAGFYVLTGRVDLSKLDGDALVGDAMVENLGESSGGANLVATANSERLSSLVPRNPDTIRIATFDIQAFGKKKSATRTLPQVPGVDVMGTLARIIQQFDLVAIQEIIDGDAVPVERLVQLINSSGKQYALSVSPPIGQYADVQCYGFVWDTARIESLPDTFYVVQDNANRMHREPWVGSFQTRVNRAAGQSPFRFTLINAKVDPVGQVPQAILNENIVLEDVFVRVREWEYQQAGEDDCILLGNLNLRPDGIAPLSRIANIHSVAGGQTTNTLRSETHSHVLIDRNLTAEYTGRHGVVDFKKDLGLSPQQALLISDHLLVWAEFDINEASHQDGVARRPQTERDGSF